MGVRTIRQFLSQKNIPSGFDRRSLIRIATALVFTIAMFAIIQWAVGTRGWDLTAGLLTIMMVALGFGLAGVLVKILRGRPLTDGEEEQSQLPRSKPHWEKMIDESLDNDPHVIGSALYRGGDD
jgi:hypothetical protein